MGRCLLLFPTTAGGTFVTTGSSQSYSKSHDTSSNLCVGKTFKTLPVFKTTHRELCTLPSRHDRSGSRTSSSPDADAGRPDAGAAGTPIITNRFGTSGTAHQLTHRQISGLARPTALRICILICNQYEGAFSRGACSCIRNAFGAGNWVSTTMCGTVWVSTMLFATALGKQNSNSRQQCCSRTWYVKARGHTSTPKCEKTTHCDSWLWMGSHEFHQGHVQEGQVCFPHQ